jgi:hypothetical protein
MIPRLAAFLFACCLAHPAFASEEPAPKPIAAMSHTDAWTGTSMEFVLYEGGDVIYIDGDPRNPDYKALTLEPPALDSLLAKLAALAPTIGERSGFNLAPHASDAPTVRLYLDVDGTQRVVAIHGQLSDADIAAGMELPRSEDADTLPVGVEALRMLLSQFAAANAAEWVPPQVEVFIWDYDYAPDESIHWPAHWPGLDAPTTVKRAEGYSLFLPGSERKAVLAFLATRKERGAVEIGGRKWAASVHPIFPGADVWGKAFAAPAKAP